MPLVYPSSPATLAVPVPGLTGGQQAVRLAGGTNSGAPVSGTWSTGDAAIARDGHLWICTSGGSPGTWVDAGSSGNLVTSVFGRTGAVLAANSDYTLGQVGAGTNHALALSGAALMGSLAVGASGQRLISQGAGADPAWQTQGYVAAYNVSNTAALSTLMSQSIPGGTLGSGGTIIVTAGCYLTNTTGVARGLTLKISYGGTAMWGDATGAAFFASQANPFPIWWQFIFDPRNTTTNQDIEGVVLVGNGTAGTIAGKGSITGGVAANTVFTGSSAANAANAQTLLVEAQLSAASANLSLSGSVHVEVIV